MSTGDALLEFLGWSSRTRHPKCKGYRADTQDGTEYECGYGTTLDCDQCKYGGGRKNPEAKRNQPHD